MSVRFFYGYSHKYFTRLVVVVMCFVLSFDMGGQAGVRNIVLPFCLIMLLMFRGNYRAKIGLSKFFFLFVIYPTLALFVGVANGAEPLVAFSQYQSTILAFILLFVLSHFSYELLSKSIYCALASTALVATVFATLVFFEIDFVLDFASWLHEVEAGYFGYRVVKDSLMPNIYFKSSLFFVPAAMFFLYSRSYFVFFVCLLGLVAATSKSGLFFVISFGIVYTLSVRKIFTKLILIFIFSIVVVLIFQSPISVMLLEIIEGDSATVDIRMGHLASLIDLFSFNPYGLLFGYGLGSSFYSQGVGDLVTNIEIDHVNTIRKYGLIWSVYFFGLVVYNAIQAVSSKIRNVRTMGICLISAFLVAGTNPVLLSPVFFIIFIVTMLANVQQYNKFEAVKNSEGSYE